MIRHTFWLFCCKCWPQKNRPAGHPNKKVIAVFQLFFNPLLGYVVVELWDIPCLIDVQIKLSLCTELMNLAWKIFVCKKKRRRRNSNNGFVSWKSLYYSLKLQFTACKRTKITNDGICSHVFFAIVYIVSYCGHLARWFYYRGNIFAHLKITHKIFFFNIASIASYTYFHRKYVFK